MCQPNRPLAIPRNKRKHLEQLFKIAGIPMSSGALQPGFRGALGPLHQTKRKIFISYHHGEDQFHYDVFSSIFHNHYQAVSDNSLDRQIDSDNVEYVMRSIRENYITGSSCTVVLVGRETWGRKYVVA
jgi:MTH538 TIR-like domain (DUF1863)